MADASFRLVEKRLHELVTLRGKPRAPRLAGALRDTLDLELPVAPNTVARGRTHDALWLGPDEWLLISHEPREPALERTLRPLLDGEFSTVVDVSSGHTVFDLGGRRAREILNKGCPLDLHRRVFALGQCAQSHYFKAAIVLRPLAADIYEIAARRSFAEYVERLLRAAADDC